MKTTLSKALVSMNHRHAKSDVWSVITSSHWSLPWVSAWVQFLRAHFSDSPHKTQTQHGYVARISQPDLSVTRRSIEMCIRDRFSNECRNHTKEFLYRNIIWKCTNILLNNYCKARNNAHSMSGGSTRKSIIFSK